MTNATQPPSRRIAFVRSTWHKTLVDRTREGFDDEARELAGADTHIDHFEVPGAFELPLHAKRLAGTGRYDAVVCAGLVVDGGIYRHEFVAQAVISGLMQVQLETDVPVISVVLTPHHFHEHEEHRGYFNEHLLGKGQGARGGAGGVQDAGGARWPRSLVCCRCHAAFFGEPRALSHRGSSQAAVRRAGGRAPRGERVKFQEVVVHELRNQLARCRQPCRSCIATRPHRVVGVTAGSARGRARRREAGARGEGQGTRCILMVSPSRLAGSFWFCRIARIDWRSGRREVDLTRRG